MNDTASPRVTADHGEIRKWAKKNHGSPALIREGAGAIDPGEPRFRFSDDERTLRDVAWDEFFREFDRRKLALLYIPDTDSEDEQTFFRLVSRDVAFEDTIRPMDDDAPIVFEERLAVSRSR